MSAAPLKPNLQVGVFEFPKPLHGEGYLAAIDRKTGTPVVIFGPGRDPKTGYVAKASVEAQIFPGTREGHVVGFALGAFAKQVAVLDELGRPWALTGPADDRSSQKEARTLLHHPAFQAAVLHARTNDLTYRGEQPVRPTHIAAILDRLEAEATESELETVRRWRDRHWLDAVQDNQGAA